MKFKIVKTPSIILQFMNHFTQFLIKLDKCLSNVKEKKFKKLILWVISYKGQFVTKLRGSNPLPRNKYDILKGNSCDIILQSYA